MQASFLAHRTNVISRQGLNLIKKAEYVKREIRMQGRINGTTTFCFVHTDRNEGTTSKRGPKCSVGISEKMTLTLTFHPNGIFGLVASASGIRYLLKTGLFQKMYIMRKGFGLTKRSVTV